MMLLYCKGGAVVGNHQDAQNVPSTAYGTGVRIIPWAGSFGELTKLGAPPPPPSDPMLAMPDNRPYAEPPPTKMTLLAYAAQLRYEKSTKGLSFTAASGAIPVKTDRVSQGLLNVLATHAQTLAPTDPIPFTQDNIAYTITASEAIAMFNAVAAQVQAGRDIETACIIDLNSVAPTILTYEHIEARFA